MSPRKITFIIIATLAAGTLVSILLQDCHVKHERMKQSQNVITDNPFYDEFRKTGARYGLNMEFSKKASCVGSTQLALENMHLFAQGPKSCDILLAGDSSMAWGLVPEVVEQMTGLKMGVFTSEALILNVNTAKMIRNLASYYLKDDGLLIISFGGWTQEQDANSMVLVYADWILKVAGMNENEFAAFIKQWKAEQLGGARKSIVRRFSFSEYRNSIGAIKNSLVRNWHLSLLQLPLYAEYIEPVVNPKWYKHKKEMKAKIQCFLRWNNRSIAMYAPTLGKKSKHSEAPPDPGYRNKDIAIVSEILNKIPCRKAYQIHINFDDAKYARLRSIYAAYYRKSCGLIDLGLEHPGDESYQVDEKEHTINTGGFYQSILIGRTLKRDFTKLGKK